MTLSKVKCKGCGSLFETDNNDKKLCQRCFKLKHYHQNVPIDSCQIDDVLKELKIEKEQICLIVDPFDLQHSLITQFKQYQDNLTIIVNKMDLFKATNKTTEIEQLIIENIKSFGFNPNAILFCSINNKSSIKRVNDYLRQIANRKKQKVIIVGLSNVGKSSIINQLLKCNGLDEILTTSNYLNTTSNYNKINFKHFVLIDTPGFLNEHSILNSLDSSCTNQICLNKLNHIRTYQIRSQTCYMIDNIVKIIVTPTNDNIVGSISFYINDVLNITKHTKNINNIIPKERFKITGNKKELQELSFSIDKEIANICISSLGLIRTKNIKNISVFILKDVGVCKLPNDIV